MRKIACVALIAFLLAGLFACGREELPEESSAVTTTQSMITEAPTTTTLIGPRDKNDIEWAKARFDEDYYENPDVIEPFQRVTTKRISKDMPEFTFTVYGFVADELYHKNMVYAIDVEERGGDYRQRLDGFTTIHPFGDNILLADFNNDGYLDIQLHQYMGGSMRNEPSLFWLWDNTKQEFVRNEQLEKISDDSRVTVYDDGRIESYCRGGALGYGLSYYSYMHGEFVEVERIDVYPEDFDDLDNSIKIRDTYKFIDGELKLISSEPEEDQ